MKNTYKLSVFLLKIAIRFHNWVVTIQGEINEAEGAW